MTQGKIAFLIRSLGVGGAQRQVVELAKGLRAAGRDVVVVTYYAGAPLEAELRQARVRHVGIGKRHRWDVAGFAWRLTATLRREGAAVVHGYLPDANLVLALLRPALRGARVVWGVRASFVDFSRYHWLAGAVFRATRVLARRADLIICNSRDGAAFHIAQGYPRDRVAVVPNGIDTRRFRPDAEGARRVRAEWGVPADAPLVGLVGRLDPMKDHETFLRAAATLVAHHPDARFAFVGEGDAAYVARVGAAAESLGVASRLVVAPPRADVESVYAALDVLTLCSAYGEGFPNVVGEAMACGTPCAVTDVGDAAWVVGDTGAVVPVGDAEALCAAWRSLLPGARAPEVAARCRARVEREFGLDALVRNTESALARLDGAA